MAKRKELTWSCMVSLNGADPVPLESLSPEQLEYCRKVWGERMGQAINEHYRNHPEEYYARFGRPEAQKEIAR